MVEEKKLPEAVIAAIVKEKTPKEGDLYECICKIIDFGGSRIIDFHQDPFIGDLFVDM
jgi:hypothetical protein